MNDRRSIEPNDEILACSLHHFFGDDGKLVGYENMFDLHHEPFNQADISSRDAKNRRYCLLVSKIVGMSRHAMTPALIEEKARLLLGQRLHLMGETDPRIELWCACHMLLQAGHTQQHQANLPAIRDITEMLLLPWYITSSQKRANCTIPLKDTCYLR